MKSTQRSTVVGVFADHRQADLAVAELHRAGFRSDQIGVAALDPDNAYAASTGTKVGIGAATGAAALSLRTEFAPRVGVTRGRRTA